MPNYQTPRLIAAAVLTAGGLIVCGCSTSKPPAGGGASADAGAAQLASDKGGAQLWTENCSRCHNLRSPDYYTPGRWALVTEHMRVRGYLTGQEEREIRTFLQSQ